MKSEDTDRQAFDIDKIRADFPILNRNVHDGVPLIYLDNAATSQKPISVIEVMDVYYRNLNANIHRGIHALAEEATEKYESARKVVANFIGVQSPKEIIFTRNTTESINLVAYSWGRAFLNPGDVVILTEMEHHSNLVPWQILAAEKNLQLEFIPVTKDSLLDLDVYMRLLELNPRLVGFTHMSNVLGTINPAKEIIKMAHQSGAITLVDGAQSVPHIPINIQDVDADFYAFSGHKMCGPSGVGVLFGRKNLLEAMPPFLGGGEMIKRVQLRSFTSKEIPHKFEAGTPAIAEVIGLGAAVEYLQSLGMEEIRYHDQQLVSYALERLSEVPGVEIFGSNGEHNGGVATFTIGGIHPHDVAQILDSEGIAVRAGHHCAMPLHEKFKIPATTRASFYLYNKKEEVDKFIESLYKVLDTFGI